MGAPHPARSTDLRNQRGATAGAEGPAGQTAGGCPSAGSGRRYAVVSSDAACSSSPHKYIYVSEPVSCTQGVNAAFTLGHKQGLKALSISHCAFCAGLN